MANFIKDQNSWQGMEMGFLSSFKICIRGVGLKIMATFCVFNFGGFCQEFRNSLFEVLTFESISII